MNGTSNYLSIVFMALFSPLGRPTQNYRVGLQASQSWWLNCVSLAFTVWICTQDSSKACYFCFSHSVFKLNLGSKQGKKSSEKESQVICRQLQPKFILLKFPTWNRLTEGLMTLLMANWIWSESQKNRCMVSPFRLLLELSAPPLCPPEWPSPHKALAPVIFHRNNMIPILLAMPSLTVKCWWFPSQIYE